MLYDVLVATVILGWMGTAIALVTMGMYYSGGGEMPVRAFSVLAFVQMVFVMIIVSWAS